VEAQWRPETGTSTVLTRQSGGVEAFSSKWPHMRQVSKDARLVYWARFAPSTLHASTGH